jgi:2-polyprenyl-6-methoxyphenol hydroxylase-like FAD-dependent oxidoreductase
MVVLPLDRLDKLLYQHTQKYSNANVKFHHRVTDVGSDASGAWIDVDTPSGAERLNADYIIGSDGANSTIRKCMFGEGSFAGETLDAQIIASNVCTLPSDAA